MISNENINEIIAAGEAEGYEISVEDISNAILARFYEDRSNINGNAPLYFGQEGIKWLEKHLSEVIFNDAEITFEDNRKAMLGLIEQTKRKLAAGEIEAKDALKIESDLRVKLNDKFKVQDDTKDKVVYVEKKYNTVCRHGYECYVPTKEDLMEMYDLVERER